MRSYHRLRSTASLLAVLVCLLAPAAAAQNETIVVDDPRDASDFPSPRRVAQLPGPDGRVTFREAVTAANNTPGPQTIHFNIPQNRWGNAVKPFVESNLNAFIITDDGLTVDGRSQTAFTGDTNPSGNEVAFSGLHPNAYGSPMIIVASDNNLFVGLDEMGGRGYGIQIVAGGDNNRVIGNTIYGTLYYAVHIESSSNNTVGGTEPGEGNLLHGLLIERYLTDPVPTGNRVVGNQIKETVVREAVGTVIGGPTAAERNVLSGEGRYFEEGFPSGTQLSVSGSTGTLIEGNYIGTTPDGLASAMQIGTRGISIQSAPSTVIRNNVVSGILVEGRDHYLGQLFGVGIEVGPDSPGTIIEGNEIGVGADGQTPVPNLQGMEFSGGSEAPVTVGGASPGDGNVIAHNLRTGVSMWAFVKRVSVLGNAIFENGLLGIDLEDFSGLGFTANDLHDPDEQGANRLQNHPVIESAALSGGTLTVTYRVDTAPTNATYPLRVEFFRADGDGEEGMIFLGANLYTAADYNAGTPGPKTAVLDVSASGLVAGALVLGTATDDAGNTSEFGAPEAVTGGAAAVTVAAQPLDPPVVIGPGGGSFEFTVTLTNATAQAQTFEAWTAVTGPIARPLVLGPQVVTLPPGATVTRTLTQQVPAQAPAGLYTYTVNVGDFPGGVSASASFPLTKQGAALASRGTAGATPATAWPLSGWEDAPAASAVTTLPGGFALSEVRPNPFASAARLTLEVAETQHVRVEVYDGLGRRVAVLHAGALEAGAAHAFEVDGASLPSGLYVVRAEGEAFSATRRVMLVR